MIRAKGTLHLEFKHRRLFILRRRLDLSYEEIHRRMYAADVRQKILDKKSDKKSRNYNIDRRERGDSTPNNIYSVELLAKAMEVGLEFFYLPGVKLSVANSGSIEDDLNIRIEIPGRESLVLKLFPYDEIVIG